MTKNSDQCLRHWMIGDWIFSWFNISPSSFPNRYSSCGFALAFDRLAKSPAFNFNAYSSNCRDYGFIPSRVEKTACCHSASRPSKSLRGPRRIRLCRWPGNTNRSSMRLAFPWQSVLIFCAASSGIKTLLLRSPLMIFLRPLAMSESRPGKLVCNFAPVIENDVFRSAMVFADSISLILWRSSFLARVPSSSAEVRGLVIHDIKEVEGVRQQEHQEDKRDEEKGDEVSGEVEDVRENAQLTHAPWGWLWDERKLKLEPQCACI